MCLHRLSSPQQPPSSPEGRHQSPSSTGKGTRREIRCLSSALLPQVQALDVGGRSRALLTLGSPPQAPPPPGQAKGQLQRAGARGTLQEKGLEGRQARQLPAGGVGLSLLTAHGGALSSESSLPAFPEDHGGPCPRGLSGTLPILPWVGAQRQGGWGRAGPGSGAGRQITSL